MKPSILLILGLIIIISCNKNDDDNSLTDQFGEVCEYKTDITSPEGFEISTIGEIDFNGGVETFQFIDEQIGFAMLGNNVGGYVEMFKTTDGGQTWENLNIGINQYPRSMLFKDKNLGIITVHDVTGCPPPNCQHKCVILKTENGGLDWEEIEFEELKGILHHPQYDTEGNLYANLKYNGQTTLLKSIDDGVHWDTLYSSPDLNFTLTTYSFKLFQDKIFVSAKDGKIVVVDTNGQFIKTMDVNNTSIWDVEIIDENNLVVVISGKVIKSTDGGDTWETIHEESARMIGFDSIDQGLMLLNKSSCPSDVYQVNDLIAFTNNGGLNWIEAEETTTNLRINFKDSQKISEDVWRIMIRNQLMEIRRK